MYISKRQETSSRAKKCPWASIYLYFNWQYVLQTGKNFPLSCWRILINLYIWFAIKTLVYVKVAINYSNFYIYIDCKTQFEGEKSLQVSCAVIKSILHGRTWVHCESLRRDFNLWTARRLYVSGCLYDSVMCKKSHKSIVFYRIDPSNKKKLFSTVKSNADVVFSLKSSIELDSSVGRQRRWFFIKVFRCGDITCIITAKFKSLWRKSNPMDCKAAGKILRRSLN